MTSDAPASVAQPAAYLLGEWDPCYLNIAMADPSFKSCVAFFPGREPASRGHILSSPVTTFKLVEKQWITLWPTYRARTRSIRLAARQQRVRTRHARFLADNGVLSSSFNRRAIERILALSELVFIPHTHHVRPPRVQFLRRHLGLWILLDSHRPHSAPPPRLGVGDRIGEGDSGLVLGVLPPDLAEVAFESMRKEVAWSVMYHRGGEVPRLVAVEGDVAADGSFPIYRHPADESPALRPFSPTVSLIRAHVQKTLDHPVNHVLIQHYRSGADYISEHSDKTIDVVRGSKIVNVSLGAQRVMTLRLKRDGAKSAGQGGVSRLAQKILLPHNSMFVLGLETNAKWLHGINHDKRPLQSKSPEEQFMNGERISLTFRHIGTFLSGDESRIYGQGAKGKIWEDARPVVNGSEEAAGLLEAFGNENQQSEFNWDAAYGAGFDVLHFTPRDA